MEPLTMSVSTESVSLVSASLYSPADAFSVVLGANVLNVTLAWPSSSESVTSATASKPTSSSSPIWIHAVSAFSMLIVMLAVSPASTVGLLSASEIWTSPSSWTVTSTVDSAVVSATEKVML